MSFYFFIASLPLLKWGEPPALGADAFAAACDDHLPPTLAPVAQALVTGAMPAGETPAFLSAWRNADNQLRNAVARQRAARRGVDISRSQRPVGPFDLAIEDGVKESFSRRNPLEREQALDRIRWDKADELAGFDPFALSALLAYAVRLHIAQRWAALDADAGREAARQLIEQGTREGNENA